MDTYLPNQFNTWIAQLTYLIHCVRMHEHDETFNIQTRNGVAVLSIFEDGIPPVFRVHFESWSGEQPLASE